MTRTKLNCPPGSVVYTGSFKNAITSLEVYTYDDSGVNYYVFTDDDIESELVPLLNTDRKIWINVIGLNVTETIIKLGEIFGLTAMVLEDIVHVAQRSKIEINKSYLFSIFKMLYQSTDRAGNLTDEVKHEHLSIIMMDQMLITLQENEGDVFDGIRNRLLKEPTPLRTNPIDYLYYELIDALVDNQLDILENMGEKIDQYEQMTLDEETYAMEDIFKIRKQLILIRASVMPFKDIMVELLSKSNTLISEDVKVYLLDVQDHIQHVNDLVVLSREMVNNIYEINMLNTGNKMNHIMSVLTVFSAVFIPLNFMTGYFGMNFLHFPGLDHPQAIPIFVTMVAIIATSMIVFFKKKKWF